MKETQLLDLKKKAQKMSEEKAELKGKLKHVKEELKTKFDCSSISEALSLLEAKKVDLEKQKKKLNKKVESIKKQFNID